MDNLHLKAERWTEKSSSQSFNSFREDGENAKEQKNLIKVFGR